jgi:hypothetical protein
LPCPLLDHSARRRSTARPIDALVAHRGQRLASPIEREHSRRRRLDETAIMETKQLGVAGLQFGRTAAVRTAAPMPSSDGD